MESAVEDLVSVALRIGSAFEGIGAAYFLGGSLASSLQGEPRATNDLHFVVDLQESQVSSVVEALGPAFEVDEEALTDAVRHRRSWNIFYLPTVLKIDLFIRGPRAFDDAEFLRRRPVEIRSGQRLYIKSPEDTVIRKLLWYRAGGCVSTTQWRDIVQVLRISGPTLDRGYLAHWATELGLESLLEKAQVDTAQ